MISPDRYDADLYNGVDAQHDGAVRMPEPFVRPCLYSNKYGININTLIDHLFTDKKRKEVDFHKTRPHCKIKKSKWRWSHQFFFFYGILTKRGKDERIIYDVNFYLQKNKVSKRKDENAGGPRSAARHRVGSRNTSGGCQGGLSVGQWQQHHWQIFSPQTSVRLLSLHPTSYALVIDCCR